MANDNIIQIDSRTAYMQNMARYSLYILYDRYTPDIRDGLKPGQRRTIYAMWNDVGCVSLGTKRKSANTVGLVIAKYHPHGDASIYGALVNLANKEIFIEKQGNFGNKFTGDGPSAGRYIECRVHPLAKDFLVTNPHITNYVPNYDGRDKEPEVYRAKIPLVLIMGAEGIAVGMSTKILPYNIKEVLDAEIKCLKGEAFELYPDVSTGGLIDVSNYNDGNGKINIECDMTKTTIHVPAGWVVDCNIENNLGSIKMFVNSSDSEQRKTIKLLI